MGKNLADFTVIVERKMVEVMGHARGDRNWSGAKKLVVSLGFWCFNPALTFRKMAEQTRSVVLTSGTLAPLNTFSSELATEFPLRTEANHVIDGSQVWATTLSHGTIDVDIVRALISSLASTNAGRCCNTGLRGLDHAARHFVLIGPTFGALLWAHVRPDPAEAPGDVQERPPAAVPGRDRPDLVRQQ